MQVRGVALRIFSSVQDLFEADEKATARGRKRLGAARRPDAPAHAR